MQKRALDYTVSSGNVFADLGLPNPEELLAKAEMAHKITVLIRERGLTRAQASELLGIDEPKLCAATETGRGIIRLHAKMSQAAQKAAPNLFSIKYLRVFLESTIWNGLPVLIR